MWTSCGAISTPSTRPPGNGNGDTSGGRATRQHPGATPRSSTAGTAGDHGAVQLSLLQGFPAAPRAAGAPVPAGELPVAQVLLDSPLAHLDRVFDYAVPEELADSAQPGVRVKVRFSGREFTGFIVARAATSDSTTRLLPLGKVLSAQPVLTPEVLALGRAVAARYAGTVSDILKVAIPPRMARVDAGFDEMVAEQPGSGQMGADEPEHDEKPSFAGHNDPGKPSAPLLTRYANGASFLRHLAAGHSPRAVLTSLGGYGARDWPAEIAEAVATVWHAGRGAVVVVPDQRDLARVEAALALRLGSDNMVRLTAEDGPTPRYRNFLKLLHGQVRVAVGTRSAAYAPVQDLGLVCIWDDGDDLHQEQRAPYQHAREVLLLRAELQSCAALLAAGSQSTEAHRLVATGWAQSVAADRAEVRRSSPRVLHTGDEFQTARDPLAARARIPHAAWKAASDGLARGPVLLQVARTGFSPALACEDCREPARCTVCTGPLAQTGRGGPPGCRWCGRPDPRWACANCGSHRLRATVAGAIRTAEELGRAFPGATVYSSAGEHILDSVPDRPAVVVATPGAEPLAPNGYAAVILLDGSTMLSRESLRAGEDTLRRWFTASLLARPASDGGLVVITADDSTAVGHLVRWDPQGAAGRELSTRTELGLPPAVRFAALTGSREALTAFTADLDPALFLRTVGPMPVAPQPGRAPGGRQAGPGVRRDAPETQTSSADQQRLLLFFSYRSAPAATAWLKARKASLSAKGTSEPVHIRCDAADLI
ncbi:primosomal protein N' (replication factor Y) [Arthrobacter sp. CAN_A212]|uniref:primosomal protein N' n=1 Tax=Arthrobacter sp. CAN_A212 TaxID=2787719 RepID=UPI001A215D32